MLRRGALQGLALPALVTTVLFAVSFAGGLAILDLLVLAGILGMSMVQAAVLRESRSLALAVLVGLGISLLVTLGLFALIPDPAAFWRAEMMAAIEVLQARGARFTEEQRTLLLDDMSYAALTGHLVAWSMLAAWLGLFLGRRWQARLVNPGGFRAEFERLRLGRFTGLVTGVVFIGSALSGSALLLNLAAVLLYAWVVVGLAALHAVAAARQWSRAAMVMVYLVFVPAWLVSHPVAMLVPMLGVADEFFDLRGLLGRVGRE